MPPIILASTTYTSVSLLVEYKRYIPVIPVKIKTKGAHILKSGAAFHIVKFSALFSVLSDIMQFLLNLYSICIYFNKKVPKSHYSLGLKPIFKISIITSLLFLKCSNSNHLPGTYQILRLHKHFLHLRDNRPDMYNRQSVQIPDPANSTL